MPEEEKQPKVKVNKVEKVSDKHKIVFRTPFIFEGNEHGEINLAGLEKLSGADIEDIESLLSSSGRNPITFEFTVAGAFAIAAKVTGLPQEFFEQMPGLEAVKLKNHILTFFTESG